MKTDVALFLSQQSLAANAGAEYHPFTWELHVLSSSGKQKAP